MQNISPDLMMKMLEVQEIKKTLYFISRFRLYAQAYVRTCTLHCLVVEIADRFLGQALKGCNILSLTKKCRSEFFCLLLKETWICFNYKIVWQRFHRRLPVLCLNISTLLLFCAFSKLTPQNQAS